MPARLAAAYSLCYRRHMNPHHDISPDEASEKNEPPLINLAEPDAPRMADKRARHKDNPWTALAMITQLGLVVAICIVGCVMAGAYIDRLVGSNGIAVLVMIPIGLGAAAIAAWQIIKQELP